VEPRIKDLVKECGDRGDLGQAGSHAPGLLPRRDAKPALPLTTRVQAALKALPRLHAKRRADDVDEVTFAPNAASSHPVNEKRSSGSGASGSASSDKAVRHRGVGDAAIQEGNKNAELMPLDFLSGLLRSPDTPHATRFEVACARRRTFTRKRPLKT